MDTSGGTQQNKLSQWIPIIKECHASGISVRLWCQENNVSEKQFYYWQRKIKQIASESLPVIDRGSKIVQVPVRTVEPATKQNSSKFVPAMVIHIGKAVIELADHVQPELLTSVLKVLSDA